MEGGTAVCCSISGGGDGGGACQHPMGGSLVPTGRVYEVPIVSNVGV